MGPLFATPLTLELSKAPGQWRLYPIGDRAPFWVEENPLDTTKKALLRLRQVLPMS
jgi:hypothetical protein